MQSIYFTITGTNYCYGTDFAEKGMSVKMIKEADNEYDKEAIRVEVDGLGKIGYVANSYRTIIGDSYSAGRIYDKIGDTAIGKVLYTLPNGILCEIESDSLLENEIDLDAIIAAVRSALND